jgi:hypothetical protein
LANGAVDFWQRGTSFSYVGGQQYTADRWMLLSGNFGRSVTRQSSGLTGFQYAARVQKDSGVTTNASVRFGQTIETSVSLPLAGRTATISFYARAGVNFSATSNLLTAKLFTGTGIDQNFDAVGGFTGAATPINSTVTLTTSWQRFSLTGTVADTSTELGVEFGYTPTGTAGANDYFEVTGMMLEAGAQSTPFARAGGSIGGELALCQRYYFLQGRENNFSQFGSGIAYSTTQAYINVIFPVAMRTVPTSIDFGSLAGQASPAGSTIAINTLTIFGLQSSTKQAVLVPTTASAVFNVAGPGVICSNNTTSGFLGLSAEL